MIYLKLTGSNVEILPNVNIEWDATHLCKPSALTEEERAMFNVVIGIPTDPPYFDPVTQRVHNAGYVQVGNEYRQMWELVELTPEEIAENQIKFATERMKSCENALENMLDTKAQERTWKDCISARTAAGYPSSFQPEGIAFVVWWEACWKKAHAILDEVTAHTRPIPTVDEFLAEMPELVLP